MSLKQYIKRGMTYLIKGQPIKYVTAQIVTLAPNTLLKGRMAIVTGGTSGIGFSIAKAFLESGASVCITGRNQNKVNAACEKLRSFQSVDNKVFGIELDNKDIKSFAAKIKSIISMGGGKKH